jgi:hypothetical protein
MLRLQHLDLAGTDTHRSRGDDNSNDETGFKIASTPLSRNPVFGSLAARPQSRRLSQPALGAQIERPGLLNINAASTKLNKINRLAATLEESDLFRGITYAIQGGKPYSHQTPEGKTYSTDNSRDTFNALKAMATEGEGHFPVMWGFRQYTPGEELTAKEMKTLQSLATMFEIRRVASCVNCRNNVRAHNDDRATAWNVKRNEAGRRWRLEDMFPSRTLNIYSRCVERQVISFLLIFSYSTY